MSMELVQSYLANFLRIEEKDVERCLEDSEKDLLTALKKTLGNFSSSKDSGISQPMRTLMQVPIYAGVLAIMPAYCRNENALTTKIVSYYPDNKGISTHQELILYFEPSNGTLKALIHGDKITEVRTALTSAIATKYLANPESKILAILGTGSQARAHISALAFTHVDDFTIHHFTEVRIWGRQSKQAQALTKEVKDKAGENGKINFKAFVKLEDCVKDADVICTCTFAERPILWAKDIKPGVHINVIGACTPKAQEIDTEIMRDKETVIYVDSRDACKLESGDIIISGVQDKIYAEIGEVISNQKGAQWQKTTVFKSVGLALEDSVVAKIVYEKHRARRAHKVVSDSAGGKCHR